MNTPLEPEPPILRGWLIWLAATLFVIYQLILQTGYAAIEPDLSSRFGISATLSGLLAGSFLLTYSAMQLPAGILLDRTDPRWLLAVAALLCAGATWWFGQASSIPELIAARGLMGAAAAFAFPGAGLMGRRWIRPAQFALSMGLVDLLFGGGAVLGNLGLEVLLRDQAWRTVMTWLAAAGVGLALILALLIRRSPRGSGLGGDVHPASIRQAVRILLAARQVRLGMLYYAGMCGTVFGFYGLWNIPLQEAFGFDVADSVSLNSWLFVGLGLGAVLSGLLADLWGRRKPFLVIGALGGCFAVGVVLFAPASTFGSAVVSLVAHGLLLGVSVLIFPAVCESLPRGYSAAAIGLVNAAGCLAGGVLQFIPGLLINAQGDHHLSTYQISLTIFLGAMVMSTVAAFLLHDTRPGWDNAVVPGEDVPAVDGDSA